MPELISSTPAKRTPPALTLATATYRRPRELAALLRSYADQLPNHASDVEIVICDNASGEDTEAAVREHTRSHPDLALRFYRQAENVGVDQNIFDVLSLAEGQFVWFIADDDEIAPGQLSRVLTTLRGSDTEILIVRSANVAEWDVFPRTGSRETEWIDPGDPRWAPMLFATPFLASIVFERDAIHEVLPQLGSLIGTCYAAWGLTLTLLSRAARVPYIDEVCVLGNANFSGESRFPSFRVMVDGRLVTWGAVARGRVREALRPLMVRHALSGLRGAAADTLTIESRGELLRAYAASVARLGPTMARGLPWVVTTVSLPRSLRRELDRLRVRLRDGGGRAVGAA